MSIAEQILIGLVTTFAAFLIALVWRMSRRRWIYWRAWRFWRPLFSGDVKIIVARFDQFNSWEASLNESGGPSLVTFRAGAGF